MPMLHSLFRAAAVTGSSDTAVVDASGRLRYDELRIAAESFAWHLQSGGARAGDRVAILMPNGVDAAIALWGVLEAGCVIVPLHAGLRGDPLLQTLRDADPQWLVVSGSVQPQQSALTAAGLTTSVIPFERTKPQTGISLPGAVREDSDLAALIYTSGSTGEPKGVMLNHANMIAAIRMVNDYLQLESSDVIYSPLPLSSSYGLYQLLLGLAVGATIVLDRSFAFPAQCLATIAREKATAMAAVPTMLAWMAHSPLLDRHDLSSLRKLTSAAASLPPEHALKITARLPQAHLYVMYGQTECKRISWLHPRELAQRAGSVGRGLAGQEHRVVNEEGLAVAPGEYGELQVRGPHVMMGYWRKAGETSRKFLAATDGGSPWMRTGDQFLVDVDGYLYFTGRTDEIMKIGGHKVSPSEIEYVLCQIPGVLEAAVVATSDDTWGEAAAAFVVQAADSQLTEQDIRGYCSQRLRGFLVPKFVHFQRELPKTASGKVLKRQLRSPVLQ
jgi:long-chain acyl-CoA synthetase